MIMDVIAWIIFGALVGWIASIIMGTNEEQGGVANIIIGIIGAFIGGMIMRMFGSDVSGFNIASLIVAIIGAMVLIAILKLFNRGGRAVHR